MRTSDDQVHQMVVEQIFTLIQKQTGKTFRAANDWSATPSSNFITTRANTKPLDNVESSHSVGYDYPSDTEHQTVSASHCSYGLSL